MEESLSQFQKFRLETVNRKKIQQASYNPRRIDENAKKRLRDCLKRVGLLRPLVVNERTMTLVSGHQRLAIIDSIERRDDYDIEVCMVDLDAESERKQNIFFNNEYAQGSYDLLKLEKLFVEEGVSFENAGFELVDLQVLLPKYEKPLTPAAAEQLADVQQVTTEIQSAKQATRAAAPKLTTAQLRAKRKEIRIAAALKHPETADVEFFNVLVFSKPESRIAFLAKLGVDPKEKFISGRLVIDRMGRHGERKEAQEDRTAAL